MQADPGLARLSDQLFWVALAVYAGSMLAYIVNLSPRRSRAGTIATSVAGAGAVVHAASVVTRGLAAERVPWGNMYEYSSLVALLLVVTYLVVIEGRFRLRQAGAFVLGLAVLLMLTARATYAPASPLQPALNTVWIKIHVLAAIVASSVFSLGFLFTVLYLLVDRSERRRAPAFGGSTVGAAYAGTPPDVHDGFPADHLDIEPDERAVARSGRGLLARLPASLTFDRLAFWATSIAFPIWTFAVIAGAMWANKAWGRYWGWDPKESWAFITWVIYAGYLHARATAGWRGRKAAAVNIAGFTSLMVTYYVVNLWIVGLHSYAGV